MSLNQFALSSSEVSGNVLQLLYVPLPNLEKVSNLYWVENAKRHDIGTIAALIEKYGFTDPPKFDQKLNNGNGGLVYGNGRVEAVVQILRG